MIDGSTDIMFHILDLCGRLVRPCIKDFERELDYRCVSQERRGSELWMLFSIKEELAQLITNVHRLLAIAWS